MAQCFLCLHARSPVLTELTGGYFLSGGCVQDRVEVVPDHGRMFIHWEGLQWVVCWGLMILAGGGPTLDAKHSLAHAFKVNMKFVPTTAVSSLMCNCFCFYFSYVSSCFYVCFICFHLEHVPLNVEVALLPRAPLLAFRGFTCWSFECFCMGACTP